MQLTESHILNRDIIAMFADASIDEILVNGTGSMALYYRQGGHELRPSPYASIGQMIVELQDLSRRQNLRLDPNAPAAGGDMMAPLLASTIHLRWHALIAPVVREGALLSLRRHRLDQIDMNHFAITREQHATLDIALKGGSPVLICGSTGSGKTSLLNAMIKSFGGGERVVIIEKTAELGQMHPNWVRLVSRRANLEGLGEFRLHQLFEEALRLRPDRIIIGEIRGEEASVAFQAMISGHNALLTTLHVTEPDLVLSRLDQLTGRGEKIDWHRTFAQVNPYVIILKRGAPHAVTGIYQFRGKENQDWHKLA